MKKDTFLGALLLELATMGYLHKLDCGEECHLIKPVETTVLQTGFYSRVTQPYEVEVLSFRYFVPIERIINDPWFWYYLSLYLKLDVRQSGHFLLWTRFIEKRCMNYSNIEALYQVTTNYA